ncbi:M48 family peptidase [Palleronia sediminis]|uniref:M48 family peptidase n=1 Tax=Palleronia sediminis TaxID=2547833 RepID=A0A4R6AD03_9RHOB|nr:SprT family zinc-dependent metalloprotease [Palleronia sediminis]TDL81891.1 M48 family peptidase [Palleronia sediminis]
MGGPDDNVKTVPGAPDLSVRLRRSGRARRITLSVRRVGGEAVLSIPKGVSDADALAFAASRADFLRRHIEAACRPCPVGIGTVLRVGGEPVEVVRGVRRGRGPGTLGVIAGPVGPQVARVLRDEAAASLGPAVARHAAALGRSAPPIRLRDTKSRWGSCSGRGGLMFSWRLILAPPPVLDYVAAHEVAHLEQMNHSPAFWAVVARLDPDHRAAQDWLRAKGGSLFALDFTG